MCKALARTITSTVHTYTETKLLLLLLLLLTAFPLAGAQLSWDKNKSGINTQIKVNGQKLETVTSFKYLGSDITDEGSKPEILSRIAQTTAALTRLKPVGNDRSISLSSKLQLLRSLVTSIVL